MRIAIDIDSTLHHYWDVLSDAARERFGVELPYEEQYGWGITRLKAEQLRCVIDATHCDAAILAGRPYPGAVEAVNRWHAAGHHILVTSHRAESCAPATARWLEEIGLAHDELHCCEDKVVRCVAAGIELLIDDSPLNLGAALEAGITPATIRHPWNEELVEAEGLIAAADWPELVLHLEAAFEPLRRTPAAKAA